MTTTTRFCEEIRKYQYALVEKKRKRKKNVLSGAMLIYNFTILMLNLVTHSPLLLPNLSPCFPPTSPRSLLLALISLPASINILAIAPSLSSFVLGDLATSCKAVLSS